MKHENIINQLFIEKLPAKHTDQLRIIKVIDFKQFYELNPQGTRKINYTYVFFKTCPDQNYPVANYVEGEPLYLDGLIGSIKLISFNSKYIPYTKP